MDSGLVKRRAERQGRKNAGRDQTRLAVLLVDRTPASGVGPPGVSKTALEPREMIHLAVSVGEHTISGKKRRLLLMIDIRKVAEDRLALKWCACDFSPSSYSDLYR